MNHKLTVFLLGPTCSTNGTETAKPKLWAWMLFLLGKRQRTRIFFFRLFSLSLVPLHLLSPCSFRLVERTRMKGCTGHVHVSWCTLHCADSGDTAACSPNEANKSFCLRSLLLAVNAGTGWLQHSRTTTRMQANTGACVCVGGHLVVVQVQVSQMFFSELESQWPGEIG